MKFRIFLVIVSCLVSLLTGLVIARGRSPARNKTDQPTMLIGFSMDTLKEERFQRDRDMFVGRARELGAEVLVQSANSVTCNGNPACAATNQVKFTFMDLAGNITTFEKPPK